MKLFSHPKKPCSRMLEYQTISIVMIAQVAVVDRSAVEDLKKPVVPIKEPNREDRKSTPI